MNRLGFNPGYENGLLRHAGLDPASRVLFLDSSRTRSGISRNDSDSAPNGTVTPVDPESNPGQTVGIQEGIDE